MKRIAPLIVALILVVGSGVLHALWTDRWGMTAQRQAAVAALQKVPLQLGNWHGRPLTMDPREQEIAEADGYALIEFVNRSTGNKVNLMIVCGRPGPVAVHPPEVCYRGAGYELSDGPVKQTIDFGKTRAEVHVAEFTKADGPLPSRLRIFWSWAADGVWQIPDQPRWTFARKPHLFKMYVVREKVGDDTTPIEQDPCIDLLRELMPVLQSLLFNAES
jgi:hypothetical protein